MISEYVNCSKLKKIVHIFVYIPDLSLMLKVLITGESFASKSCSSCLTSVLFKSPLPLPFSVLKAFVMSAASTAVKRKHADKETRC